MTTFGFTLDQAIVEMRLWLFFFSAVRSKAFVVFYDEIDHRPLEAAFRIGEFLYPDVRAEEMYEIGSRYKKDAVNALSDRLIRGQKKYGCYRVFILRR